MDKGITCMFIGYCLDHAGDCYKMYNPLTKRFHITRDVKWLDRMYFKDVRFHTTANLTKLKAGKSDMMKSTPNFNNFSDEEDEIHNVDEEVESTNDDSSTSEEEEPNEDDNNDSSSDSEGDNNDSSDDSVKSNPFKTSTEDRGEPQSVTKSGRISYAPKFMLYNQDNEEVANSAFSREEMNFYSALQAIDDFGGDDGTSMTGSTIKDEIALIGAGVGGGFKFKEYDEMEIKFVSICADFDGEQMESSETGLLNNGLALKDISNHDKYWIGDTETTTNATSTLAGIYLHLSY